MQKKSIIVIFLKKNELYEKKPMQVRVLGPDKGYRFYIKVTCMKSEVANLLSLNNGFFLTKRISKINLVINPLFFQINSFKYHL